MFRILAVAATLALVAVPSSAQYQGEGTLWQNPHRELITTYEGTKTCLACHEQQAKDVFSSVHYQWKADAPNIVNARGKKLGKINTSNDFCTNPSISWIAILKNDRGQVIGNGCSKCHTGLGLKPAEEVSQAQLENIDCLLCHASNYQREVVAQPDGTLRWQPVALKNPEAMLNIAQNVGRPTNAVCLGCHVGSGGGMNFKRGDLETVHARATRDFDVHLGSRMQCIQCHQFKAHRILGSGTQMGGQDRPGEPKPRCENCHRGAAHPANAVLDRHTQSVACTTCHIPTYARHDRTDMRRDWSRSEPVPGQGRFEPHIEFETNVTPVYAWWNGTGTLGLLDEPVKVGPNGKVALYRPEGSIRDPAAKIYPFKYHEARLPIDEDTRLMIPIAVGIVFRTGDNAAAVKAGAKSWFGKEVANIGWIETERYLGLFHEVVGKEDALRCAACHTAGGRLDWKALGYTGDPQKVGGRTPEAAR